MPGIAEMLAYMAPHLINHAAGLEGHSRHGYEHFAAALKPHQRRSAETVHNHAARRRHPRLRARELVELKATHGENTLDIRRHSRIFNHRAAENLGHHAFGDIIACGAEATCGDYEVGACERVVDGAADVIGLVAYRAYAGHFPAYLTEFAGY